MRVSALAVDPLTTLPVVILNDEDGDVSLPIRVGLNEASALAAEIDAIELERPMTHQLMSNMLAGAGVRIESVEVVAHVEGTFYASVNLRLPSGERIAQDARPSDALSLALRAGATILVARDVVEESGCPDLPVAELSPLGSVPGCDRGTARPDLAAGMDEGDATSAVGDEVLGKWKM